MGQSKGGISRKRGVTMGNLRVLRTMRDGGWGLLRSFGLMSSLRPQAKRIWEAVQRFGHRSGVKSRLKGSRLAWAVSQRSARQ